MSRIAAQLVIDDTNLHRSLSAETEQKILSSLKTANEHFIHNYPGNSEQRQPVHTFYGGAHLFNANTVNKLGTLALLSMDSYAGNFAEFAKALGMPSCAKLPSSKTKIEELRIKLAKEGSSFDSKNADAWISRAVFDRVKEKLKREPVEDYRVDFEDGFGYHIDSEEDHEAMRTATETARAMEQDLLPPFFGIRIKSFSEESKKRSIRTLDIYLTTLCEKTGGRLPENFVITLPKVVAAEQVSALTQLLKEFERVRHLPDGPLKFEFMVESPQIIVSSSGVSLLPAIIAAGEGRCVGAHFGPYDYTIGLNISSQYQTLDHPSNDFARHVMQVTLAGTGVRLSDGAIHLIPVGPHREAGKPLTVKQKNENREAVHRVWKNYYAQIQRSLIHGFYQSWDLHPGHLPIRYAAVYSFFLEGLAAATMRLRSSIDTGSQASLNGQMFDDAASGQGLLNYFLRAFHCGAISADDIQRAGLSVNELKTNSFQKIISGRKK